MTPGQVQDYYESGANLADFRGHAQTPEHPGEAERNPKKYGAYLNRKSVLIRKAIDHVNELIGDYFKFNETNVKDRIRGKKSRHLEEDGKGYRGMTRDELKWTINATEEELIQRATPQYDGNKWWYH